MMMITGVEEKRKCMGVLFVVVMKMVMSGRRGGSDMGQGY
jgi:hypothetical protein